LQYRPPGRYLKHRPPRGVARTPSPRSPWLARAPATPGGHRLRRLSSCRPCRLRRRTRPPLPPPSFVPAAAACTRATRSLTCDGEAWIRSRFWRFFFFPWMLDSTLLLDRVRYADRKISTYKCFVKAILEKILCSNALLKQSAAKFLCFNVLLKLSSAKFLRKCLGSGVRCVGLCPDALESLVHTFAASHLAAAARRDIHFL
jgi:hypothetical protein